MTRLEHRFVEFIPKELENNVIYISIRFRTVIHKCACGCGIKTVTPLSPTDWKLIFNGKYVSLDPSIGNWGFPCKSHYWISNNRIEWATEWTKTEIKEGKLLNKKTKEDYYRDLNRGIIREEQVSNSPWWKLTWLFKK